MSTLVARTVQTPDGSPVSFPNGIMIGTATGAGSINHIGTPGQQGFGVGIAPSLPYNFAKLYGTDDPASDTYGNYQYTDGSIMVYVPAFYYKYGTGANGFALNVCDVKAFSYYADVATANAAGYALHRAFYNGGKIRPGVFVDKYLCSNNSGTASSLKNGVVLSSAVRGGIANTAFATLTGAPDNTFAGAIAAAKTRGASFFCSSIFINKMLALLSLAHGSAASSTTYCAWYSAGSTNFPKGNNNNALGDAQDATIAYVWDGNATYAGCGKTGSANFFSKTAHNGQNCGVVDLNGLVYEISPGLTMDGATDAGKFYVLKTSADMSLVTGSNTLATDLWGATGLAALYDDLGVMSAFTGYALNFSDRTITMGSASQVLSAATSGTAWQMTAAGVPLVAGGSNQFGNDYIYDYSTADMCPLCGGNWSTWSAAGVWLSAFSDSRANSAAYSGFRSALYL
jgi:hypothetical protein